MIRQVFLRKVLAPLLGTWSQCLLALLATVGAPVLTRSLKQQATMYARVPVPPGIMPTGTPASHLLKNSFLNSWNASPLLSTDSPCSFTKDARSLSFSCQKLMLFSYVD